MSAIRDTDIEFDFLPLPLNTYTWFVGDPAFLVVACVTLALLGRNIIGHEGGVTLLRELVVTHHLVLPHRLRNLKIVRVNNLLSNTLPVL